MRSHAYAPVSKSKSTRRPDSMWSTDSARILGAYCVVLLALLLWRLSMDGSTYTHFTYWGLTLSFLLGATWLVAMYLDGATWVGRVPPGTPLPTWEGMVLMVVAVPVLGVLFAVAVLITAMPILDVDIIVAQGGDMSLAVVNVANIVIHYLPPVVIVVVLHMRWAVFSQHLWWLTDGVKGGVVFATTLVATACMTPLGIACMYSATIDFNKAYGVNVRPLYVYNTGLFTCIAFCGFMWPAFLQAMNAAGAMAAKDTQDPPQDPSPSKKEGAPAVSHSPLVLAPYVVTVLGLFMYRWMTNTFSMHHFTYWGLSLSCLFALAWISGAALDAQAEPSSRGVGSPLVANSLEGAVLVFGAVPTLGVLVCVAALISAVPILDINIVEAQAEGHPLGVVNAVNLAMHYVPPALLLFVLHQRWIVFAAHLKVLLTGLTPEEVPPAPVPRTSSDEEWVNGAGEDEDEDEDEDHTLVPASPLATTLFVLASAVVTPLCIANVYSSNFDFNVAYGVHIAPISIHAVGISTCVLYGALVTRVCTVAMAHTHKYDFSAQTPREPQPQPQFLPLPPPFRLGPNQPRALHT